MRERPYQANRVLAFLSKMFNLAVKWGWRTDNPVKGIKIPWARLVAPRSLAE